MDQCGVVRPLVEMTIVSLLPSRTMHSSTAGKKLTPSPQQLEDKRNWKGAQAEFCGRPVGLRLPSSSIDLEENKCSELLRGLTTATPRPQLIKFHQTQSKEAIFERATLPEELHYKLYKSEARLVRTVLEQSGFTLTESYSDWNLLWAGAAPPTGLYSGLASHQKINHHPGASQLSHKDLMYRHISKAQTLYGKAAFDFVPETFVLPSEFQEFVHRFEAATDIPWIAKPCASSQGKGVFLVERLDQLLLTEPYVVSQYISTPLLIQNLKFDMRIYVLVTSYDPLRIYVYKEGLARFASEEYAGVARKDHRCMHLTNYSINKRSSNYIPNSDFHRDNVGHKWSLSALFTHLESLGADTDFIWTEIYDIIVKAVISVQEEIIEACEEVGVRPGHCFDLFGFDVLLDNALKPWLLEVNLSPSLATDSSLDLFVKSNLLIDTFNLVGLHRQKHIIKDTNPVKRKGRTLSRPPSRISMSRQTSQDSKPSSLREILRTTLEEYQRKGHFIRIYPSQGTQNYEQYLSVGRNLARWVHWVLFEGGIPDYDSLETNQPNKLIWRRSKVNVSVRKLMSKAVIKRTATSLHTDKSFCTLPKSEKILVTGDDILLEYISRLTSALVSIPEDTLPPMLRKSIEAFISHPVWKDSSKNSVRASIKHRLEVRFSEMQMRRLRITESEARIKGGFRENPLLEEQRKAAVGEFSAAQLEAMLRVSTRSLARQIVQPLLGYRGVGVLSELLAWQTKSQGSEEEESSCLVSPAPSRDSHSKRSKSTFKSLRIC